ncbi:MAG: site-specific integrase [Lachnospiraceae bacterium]|nr:site-specific integrase [Lachnospiraceae bacterium]
MAVYKDKWNGYKGNSWRVACYYTDWKGIRRKHEKRGFATKKEALAYEREFLAKKTKDINMGFGMFVDIYMDDLKPQIKASTFATKENIINTHIRPYFENKSLSEVTSTDVLQWQNALLGLRDGNGKGYSPTYLRTIQNQLNAIFNHAVKYYDLPKNPCIVNKKMGRAKAQEMLFWTKEEYLQFSEVMKDKPISYYAFQILYWTGIRCGELLALTKADFDLEKRILRINKNFQVIKGEKMIVSPKTEKGNRLIDLPEFLCVEMEEFFDSLYKVDENSRIFAVTKSYLHHEMDRGCRISGVKRIRIHDLRHSSCALLINLGYSPIQIAERLGHESVTITERYSHLYPSVQREMANSLDKAFSGEE